VQEVADRAVDDAVVEVADAAREDEADRDMRGAHAHPRAAREEKERRDRRDDREDDEQLAPLLADAEHGAVIEDEAEVEEVERQRAHAAVMRHIERRVVQDALALELDGVASDHAERPVLRPEVERHADGEHAYERRPRERRAPGELLAGVVLDGRGLGRQRCGRIPDSGVLRRCILGSSGHGARVG